MKRTQGTFVLSPSPASILMKNLGLLSTFCVILSYTHAFTTTLSQPWRNSLKENLVPQRSGRSQQCMSAVVTTSERKRRKIKTLLDRSPGFTKRSYATILNSLSNERTWEAAEEAEEILFSLETNRKEKLNVIHYASVINGWANAGDSGRAESILNHMIELSRDESFSSQILPNSHCFSGVMKSYIINDCRSSGKEANENGLISEKCEKLVDNMIALYEATSSEDVKPNTVVYNTLLSAYAEDVAASSYKASEMNIGANSYPNILDRGQQKDKYKIMVETAVAILDKMESTDFPMFPAPDVYTYSTIFSLLAKCGDVKSATLAESYLPKIAKNFDTPTYNSLMSAWARTCTVEGARRADSLLEKLEDSIEYTSIDDGAEIPKHFGPNTISYFTVMSAWVKSCSIGDMGSAALKAEAVLDRMESKLRLTRLPEKEKLYRYQPNVIAYSSIIDCWSKSGSKDAAVRVKALLERMDANNVKPNVFTYTSCLATYSRSNSEKGAKEATALLARMKEMYLETGDEKLKPTIVSYFTVIDGWARSNSEIAGEQAEILLLELEDRCRQGEIELRPDVRVYARVVSAYIKSTKKGSDFKAAGLLKRMEKFALTGNEKFALAAPNVVCYNTLISAFGRRGLPIKAFQILNQMDQFNSKIDNENDKVTADEHSFNSIIYALSRSDLKGKARKAMKMLERLDNSHVDGDWRSKPSSKSYNMVIATCSNSFKAPDPEKMQALSIATNVFSRLKTSPRLDPDRYTYILMLKACGKLLPTKSLKRRNLVENVFKECCNDGLVDNSILSNFLIAAPKELSKQVLEDAQIDMPRAENLPATWTRHVNFR